MSLIRREQIFGALNQVLIVVIVALMIVKPGGVSASSILG